jgi:hypothetical protein
VVREIGGMTVGELERRIDSRELAEWAAVLRWEQDQDDQAALEQRARLNAKGL